MTDEQIRKLREANAKLANFLHDPHPGLITWTIAVTTTMQTMANILDGKIIPVDQKETNEN